MKGSPQTENLKTVLNSALEHTFEKSFELFLMKVIIVTIAADDFKCFLQFCCYMNYHPIKEAFHGARKV